MVAVFMLTVVHLAVVVLVVTVSAVSFRPYWSQIVCMINFMVVIMPSVNLNLPVNDREREA